MKVLALAAAVALAACSAPPFAPGKTKAGAVSVSVAANQRVKSPLRVTGVAPNDWFFEAVFPVRLLDANGVVIAEAPAQAQSDWMTPGPVPFAADLAFAGGGDQPATLLLQEDMPRGEGAPREVRVPVLLTQ